MILSSTTRFIIPASNTGKCAKLMGNGRSYRLPGRNTVIADLRLGKSAANEAATLAIRRGGLGAARRGSGGSMKRSVRSVMVGVAGSAVLGMTATLAGAQTDEVKEKP